MKLLPCLALGCLGAVTAPAATTINATHKFAYGANLGWINAQANTNNGAVIGAYVCSGFLYSANVGWINLGNGAPANAIRYQNNSSTDFGVNHDGVGNLRGSAYGANIGWIQFESLGNPRVSLDNGALSGSIYSANCGWISLSNAFAFVQTDRLRPGLDTDGDGIADAWEYTHTNTLAAFTATSDRDGDGSSDLSEYLADTNPFDTNSVLRITRLNVNFTGGTENDLLTWSSSPARRYRAHSRTNLNAVHPWLDYGSSFIPGVTNTTRLLYFPTPAAQRYFQVQAFLPLP